MSAVNIWFGYKCHWPQGQLLSYSDVYFANLSKSESEKKLNPKIFVKINQRVHKYK